ncbi:class I SAM-dependent DNA methyltransferase [Chondromyces apiculatus]|uniref:Methyltransferase type 11 n=1 Tax=Chondromyces apiculatus DSM 436 TaxID=1192034 RepID=A0A017THG5_9BACT|nr:class I SAM-dependent methyltransferase [Chondromyces apiculatus]EYF08275.1 Methyltransferase type 11 [Chondromyces apiculatus DSM 436]
MHRLFGDFAHRYDLHTPPEHYRHDHAYVLDQAKAVANPCRMLDVGCGTGVLLDKARQAGVLATGIDASPAMIRVARTRAGQDAATVRRMQDLDDEALYDLVVSLSWTLNYCEGRADLLDILRRIHRALRPGGRAIFQIAHAPHASGQLLEDREAGPRGDADDVVFLYRFQPGAGDDLPMRAEYVYACKSLNELLHEEHLLRMTDAHAVAECTRDAGFSEVVLYDSWQRDPFRTALSPLLCASKAPAP